MNEQEHTNMNLDSQIEIKCLRCGSTVTQLHQKIFGAFCSYSCFTNTFVEYLLNNDGTNYHSKLSQKEIQNHALDIFLNMRDIFSKTNSSKNSKIDFKIYPN